MTRRFWTLDTATDENRIAAVSAAANAPMVALVDERVGGVVAYVSPSHADLFASVLNDRPIGGAS